MASLSVCIFSDRPSTRLAAIVAPLREVADEIVVAIDDRVPDPDLTPLVGIADKAIVAPFTWPLEANLEWLHNQCSGDWVLRLDGDEVPSRTLVNLLADDDWQRGVTHCFVTRRWLVDEGTAWIRANPWWPDTQLRLIKNEPGLMRSGGGVHQTVDVAGPHRVLSAPIYHLDLIETDLDTRRAKSRRYYRARPELRTHGGLSMGAFYTPELVTPNPPTIPLPREDHLLVHAAVVQDHRLVQMDRNVGHATGPSVEPGQSVSVDVVHVDRSGYAGRYIEILVTVTNTGTESYESLSGRPFRLGGQWVDRDGTTSPDEPRADIPHLSEPGRSETALMLARIPETAGEYMLSIGALEEGRRWLSRAPEIRFTVLDQPHVSLVAGYSRHRHLGDDLIVRSLIEDLTDEFPQLRLTLLADSPESVANRFGVPTLDDGARIHQANIALEADELSSVDRAISSARHYLHGGEPVDAAVADLTDAIRSSDALLIAAAGSLTSEYSDAALWPRLIEAEIATALDIPVVITSAGIGPFGSDIRREGATRLLNIAREIHVRDEESFRAVTDLEVSDPAMSIVPDAASGYRATGGEAFESFLRFSGIDRDRPYLVTSTRPGDDVRIVGQIARSVKAAAFALDAVAVLLPHCASHWVDDRPALAGLAALLEEGDVRVVNLADTPPDPLAAELVRSAAVSIGTRFHNGVLSTSAGHPAILFGKTDYDRGRARGLAAWSGARVGVMSESTKLVNQRTRRLLRNEPQSVRYPNPHPIIGFVRALGSGPTANL